MNSPQHRTLDVFRAGRWSRILQRRPSARLLLAGLMLASAFSGWSEARASEVDQHAYATYEIISVDGHAGHALDATWVLRESETGTDTTVAGLSGYGSTRILTDGMFQASPDQQGSVRRLGLMFPRCGAAVGVICQTVSGLLRDLTVHISMPESAATRWFLTARNADRIDPPSVVGRFWRVLRVAPLGLTDDRPARSADNNHVELPATAASVEHFTRASTVGGASGSVTVAIIPCDGNQGVGQALLTGAESTLLSCTRNYASIITTWKATRWILQGDVVGHSTAPTRLLTLDLPR